MLQQSFKLNLKKIPSAPGVYIFRDQNRKVLYVGKAKRLRDRVCSYFQKSVNLGPKTQQIVNKSRDLKFIVTDTEFEALLLEADLIKRLRPYYNSQWKDDKRFKYLAVGPRTSQFPRIYTPRTKTDSQVIYFGPYPEGKTVNNVLRILRRIFPFRDCTEAKFNRYQKLGHGCLHCDLKLCPAPCVEKISEKDYKKRIFQLTSILKGKKERLMKELKRDMDLLSQQKKFEEAAEVRDIIKKLEYITQRFSSPDDYLKSPNLATDLHEAEITQLRDFIGLKHTSTDRFRLEAFDISNIQGKDATGSMVVFISGRPIKEHYRRFKIRLKNTPDDVMMLKEILQRRFKNWRQSKDQSFSQTPDLVLIDGGVPQLNAALSTLKMLKIDIPTVALAKREEILFTKSRGKIQDFKLPQNAPALHLLQRARDEAHRFALYYHRKLRSIL